MTPRAFGAMFRVDLLQTIQYRGESFLWAIWGVIYPVVALAMWEAAAEAPAEGSNVAAYAKGGFAAYFLLTMIVGHVVTAWDAYEMGWVIRSGEFSAQLMRPMLPIWRSIAGNLAWKLFTLVILTPFWILVAWMVEPRFEATAGQLVLGLVATVLAAGIAFVWGYVVALTAFWTTRNDAVGEFWFGASLLVGGRLAPIALLPVPLQFLAGVLPHQWALGFPCEVLTGQCSDARLYGGLAAQAAWLVGGAVIFRLLWSKAIRRYTAVGG